MLAVEQGREALVPARKERGHEFGVVRVEAGDVDGHLLAVTLPLETHVARTAIACNMIIIQRNSKAVSVCGGLICACVCGTITYQGGKAEGRDGRSAGREA